MYMKKISVVLIIFLLITLSSCNKESKDVSSNIYISSTSNSSKIEETNKNEAMLYNLDFVLDKNVSINALEGYLLKAKYNPGEVVKFKVSLKGESALNVEVLFGRIVLKPINGIYIFTMPGGNVVITVNSYDPSF